MTGMAKVANPKPRGQVIEATRAGKGMTRRQLAEKTGLAYVTVYNLECGYNPRSTRETLQRIANALGVDYAELVEPAAA